MDQYGGIYFRDEGDCIISLFSSYFGLEDPYAPVDKFCKAVVRARYGTDRLTAKAIVAEGEIAFYQKSNEIVTGDWSAEGEPFIRAIRVEQAVESKQRIYYFADEYDALFSQYTKEPALGKRYYWQWYYKYEEIQGLGSIKLVIDEYIPRGKVDLSPDIISYLRRLNR